MPLPVSLSSLVSHYTLILVPGLRNSDAHHWQTKWQQQLPESLRVELPEWETPDLLKWQQGIREQIARATKPIILVAHSFGTLASASIAEEYSSALAGLFLVAPADPDKFGIDSQLPSSSLPVSTHLIASSNDPWLSAEKAFRLAKRWNTSYIRYDNVGHINSDSGLDNWDEGQQQLAAFIQSLPNKTLSPHTSLAA